MLDMIKESIFYNMTYVTRLIISLIIIIIISGYYKKNKILYGAIIILLCIAFFFRNNTGMIIQNNDYFISPSSSKIKQIYKDNKNRIIYTYLSPMDKHFMIAPVNCTIIGINSVPISETDTERMRVTFKDENGKIFSLDQTSLKT